MDAPDRRWFEDLVDLLREQLEEQLGGRGLLPTDEVEGLAEVLAEAVGDRFDVVPRDLDYQGLDYEVARWSTNFDEPGVGSRFIAMLMERSAVGLELLTAIPTDRPSQHFLVFKGSRQPK